MTKTAIRCYECNDGLPRPKVVEHDVGALLGLDEVRVSNLPALVCPVCGAVTVDGKTVETVAFGLAALILQRPTLEGVEVRFLRKLLGDTQTELADRLGVDRVSVNRWENATDALGGAQAYAVRSHAFFRLLEHSPIVESAKASFVAPEPPPKLPARPRYRLEGRRLRANAA